MEAKRLVTVSVLALVLLPHGLIEVTERFPDVNPDENTTSMEVSDVLVKVAPEGTVQKYEVALATLDM